MVAGDRLQDYFHTPGDTLQALSSTLPYINSTLQGQLKAYLKTEQTNYPVQTYANIGWKDGAKREAFDDTPEMTSIISGGTSTIPASNKQTELSYLNCCGTWLNIGNFPADAFYGAWKYAQATLTPAEARTLFDSMKGKLQKASNTELTDANFLLWPYLLNQYIDGYRGYLELEKLAGYTTDISQSTQYAEYQRLLNLRLNNFSKNSPFSNYSVTEYNHNFVLNVARNFMFLTPELGNDFSASRKAAVQQAMDEYQIVEPYWFVPKFERTYEEGIGQPLWDRHALFLARAYILKQPFSELVKYLDVPAFAVGDLHYIENLVAVLQAPTGGTTATTSSAVNTFKPGDANGDGKVDGKDYAILLNHYGQAVQGASNGDFNGDGKVDVQDYWIWLNNNGS